MTIKQCPYCLVENEENTFVIISIFPFFHFYLFGLFSWYQCPECGNLMSKQELLDPPEDEYE